MQKSGRFSENQLHQLGYAVVGDQAVHVGDGVPDDTWDLDRLAGYAAGQIAESVLCAHKSAVALFRAGGALALARARCKSERRGAWTKWKRKHGLKGTSVNDAIRLHENTGSEEALAGLGITKAKKKYVYPAKSEGGDTRPRNGVGRARRAARSGPKAPATSDSKTQESSGSGGGVRTEPGAPSQGETPETPAASMTLGDELEGIAQRVNEIAQDEAGKVDWSVESFERVENAVMALNQAAADLLRWLNEEKTSA